MLNESERARIADAITAAEAKTTAEICCVLAAEASNYRELPLAFGATLALVALPIAFLFGLNPDDIFTRLGGWWMGNDHDQTIRLGLSAYAIAQAVAFVVGVLIADIPPIHRLLTPGFLSHGRVRKAAMQHFSAIELALQSERPLILIYAAHHERRVEVLGNARARDALGPVFGEAAAAFAEGLRVQGIGAGFEAAVVLCANALSRAFPATGADANLLPNTVQETG